MPVIQQRPIRSQARQQLTKRLSGTRRILKQAADEHAEYLLGEFQDVVSDWKKPPQFVKQVEVQADRITVSVRPYKRRKASQIFHWVDKGTRGPYVIQPKRRRPKRNTKSHLAFRTGYQPRTLPIAQAHVGPGRAAGPWVRPQKVVHPGIKPRHFSRTIQEKSYPRFRRRLESAMKRALRKKKG